MFVTNKAFQKWIKDFVGTKTDEEICIDFLGSPFFGNKPSTIRESIRNLKNRCDKLENKIEKLEAFIGAEYKVIPEKEGYFVKKTKKSK